AVATRRGGRTRGCDLPCAQRHGNRRRTCGCREAALRVALVERLSAMIALLRGTLVDKNPNRLIVDAGGVGYDVQVPLSTFYELGEPGTPVTLRIHTHVR